MTMNETHPNVAVLRTIYQDLRRIADFSHESVVLHPAERSIRPDALAVVGKQAVLAKELELIRMTEGSLIMDVTQIVANEFFGAVLGILRAAKAGRELAIPFCGLWRFRDGLVVEHWENAYDASAMGSFLTAAA